MNPLRRRFVAGAAATVVAVTAPTARTWALTGGWVSRPLFVAAAGSVATAAVFSYSMLHRSASRVASMAVASTSVLVAAWAGGRTTGVWLAALVLLAVRGGAARDRYLSVAVSMATASVVRAAPDLAVVIASTVALAGTTWVELVRPTWSSLVRRRLLALIERSVALVGSVLMTVVGLTVFVLPWALHVLTGGRRRQRRRSVSSSWVALGDAAARPIDARRLWSPDPGVDAGRAGQGGRRVAQVLLVAGVVAATLAVDGTVRSSKGDDATSTSSAFAPAESGHPSVPGEPWVEDTFARTARLMATSELSQYVGVELADVSSPYLHVEDGRRRSWSPSARACGATVWLFGGSAAFGIGQRDDHTIASELERLATDDAVPMSVVNWAVPGDVGWQENRRLERALDGGARPDLVVFYDGFNDLWIHDDVASSGRDGSGKLLGMLDNLLLPVARRLERDRSGGYRADPPPTVRKNVDVETVASNASAQYGAAHTESIRLTTDVGIPMLRFLQPSMSTRSESVPAEPRADDERARELAAAFRRKRPPDVIDLSATFDGMNEPVFLDAVHTNELGARRIAAMMWPTVADRVRALPGAGRTPTC